MAWLVVFSAGCAPRLAEVRDVATLRQVPLYTFHERELDAYLRWLSQQPLGVVDRVRLLARQNLGQPYRLYSLGEFPYELYDPDPLYRLEAGDCVTFVEQTYAMALARDWPSFFATLQRIRYREGEIGIATRNHYLEADWNVNNAWLFDDVTADLGGTGVRSLCGRIDRAALLRRLGIESRQPVQIISDVYIGRARLGDCLPRLLDGDIVEFVKGNEQWQYVSHVGLILHDAAGRATLLHSAAPAVREESLEGYLQGHPDFLGVKILRLTERRHFPTVDGLASDR